MARLLGWNRLKVLRQAHPSDAKVIEKLRVAAWKLAYAQLISPTLLSQLNPANLVEGAAAGTYCQSRSYSVVVAERDHQLVGFLALGSPRYETVSDVAELWCLKGNGPARRVYEKAGYSWTGLARTSNFHGVDGNCLHEVQYGKVF